MADGIIIQPVDVEFRLIHRPATGSDVRLATWNQHFDPLGGGSFDAQPYEVTADCEAIVHEDGDQLIFEYIGTGAAIDMAYIPNGDGALQNGRIPYLDLPQAE